MNEVADISVINRHRIYTDGEGVNTLVALYGCPLHCRYCINEKMHHIKRYRNSAEELYQKVKIDDLYFRYTNGGICFGGHEPLLQSAFIESFAVFLKEKHIAWKLTLETSLNVMPELLNRCVNFVDHFIIDIKTMDRTIYKQYTGSDNKFVLENLNTVINNKPLAQIKIRLPRIPNYTNTEDVEKSKLILKSEYHLKNENIEVFEYIAKPSSFSAIYTLDKT